MLNGHDVFDILNTEVFIFSVFLQLINQLLLIHLPVNVCEKHANLKESDEATNLTETHHNVLRVASVKLVDILQIESNKLYFIIIWLAI